MGEGGLGQCLQTALLALKPGWGSTEDSRKYFFLLA